MPAETIQTPDTDQDTQVRAGIALLERTLGPTWADDIDLRTLDLEDDRCCIFGQLYGSFHDGALALWSASDESYSLAVEHGFYLPGMETDGVESEPGARANYGRLTEAWRRALTPTVTREKVTA